MKNKEIVILDSVRTPIGKYKGALAEYSSVELGIHTVSELLKRNENIQNDVEQVIFGSVLQAGQGQNIARQISVKAGLSVDVPASTINEVCGSGLKAVLLARQLIQLGEAELVIAGGTESMSNTPQLKTDAAGNAIYGFTTDGLMDAFSEDLMGLTVEVIADDYQISREKQDQFAWTSHQKAAAARDAHKFDHEIVPINEQLVDQSIREASTIEKLGTLRTVFKEDGVITAANASPINDGSVAVLLASKDYADEKGLTYSAVIKGAVEVGVEPALMALSPIKAINKLLAKTELSVDQIDLFEINEAFAASSIIIEKELAIPAEKINIYGGAIALGHPLGATGARLISSLANQLKQENKRYGVAALCIGGGLGLAVLLENSDLGVL